MNPQESTPQASLDRLLKDDTPFAIIQKERSDEAYLLSGDVQECETLDQIPRQPQGEPGEFRYDTLSLIPFTQAKERGLDVIPDASRIRCMQVRDQTRLSLEDLLHVLPSEPIRFAEKPHPRKSDEQYESEVRRVIEEHIRKGDACNVVISLEITGIIAEMSPRKALTIFRNILTREFGAYMTFFFYDGKEYHIGASPERHITVDHGEVTMNPISGTCKKVNFLIDRKAIKEFLRDPKEINELFMCVDEEVKQMAQMCEEGGTITGPHLKEMSGLVHTEYYLIGRSAKDCIDLLRMSLHAPTVTGSPMEPAMKIIKNIEGEPRNYYAGELVLLGHHPDGTEFLDSVITIRTMHILPNGLLAMRVGASIVRDSSPAGECKEVHAKAGGVQRAVEGTASRQATPQLPGIMDEEMNAILRERNVTMNTFLLENQSDRDRSVEELKDKTVTIIDFEDQFSFVLKHMLDVAGARTMVKRFDDVDINADASDIVIVGPGPHDPRDESDPKMRALGDMTSSLLRRKRPFLSVCLGHQKLCEKLGMDVEAKIEPSQGMQRDIDFFGNKERLGFYNTFTARRNNAVAGVDVCADPETGEVFAVRGDHFSGFQFHPESIMSQNGFSVLTEELKRLVRNKEHMSI